MGQARIEINYNFNFNLTSADLYSLTDLQIFKELCTNITLRIIQFLENNHANIK